MENFYDRIATVYDSLYEDPASLQEEQDLLKQLPPSDSVLDIGCGTGLYLRYRSPKFYTGIDPSVGMLQILASRYPQYSADVFVAPFEAFVPVVKYNLIVALFGSANHIDPASLARIPQMLTEQGTFAVMIFKPDYYPHLYTDAGVFLPYWKYAFIPGPGLTCVEFNNYYIVQGNRESVLQFAGEQVTEG